MIVAINLMRFHPDVNIGGNYTFCFNIIKNFIDLETGNTYYLLVSEKGQELFNFDHPRIHYKVMQYDKNIFKQIFNENKFLKNFLKEASVDIYYSPSFLLPLNKIRIPSVATIHDLNFKHFSQGRMKDIYKNFMYKKTIKNADFITTISNFSKNDIHNFYSIDKNRVITIYNGNEPLINNQSKVMLKEKYNIENRYLLCMCHHKHKNPLFAIDAYTESIKDNENIDLVITGPKGEFKKQLQDYVNKKKIENRVVFIEFVDNEDLALLYTEAEIFLFPSLFEGFGLPVLEAMSVGCPVISSNATSLPEVLGKEGIVLPVDDLRMWSEYIRKLLDDDLYRSKIVEAGVNRANKFSWSETSLKILDVFEQVYKKSQRND